jgi:hypothetical protein
VTGHLPSKHGALNSNSIAEKRKKEQRRRERRKKEERERKKEKEKISKLVFQNRQGF